MTGMSDHARPKTPPRCPQCGKPRALRYRPFCSPRCRDLDLGKWLDGSYAVPAVEEEPPDERAEEGW
jgi:hypothetical protein